PTDPPISTLFPYTTLFRSRTAVARMPYRGRETADIDILAGLRVLQKSCGAHRRRRMRLERLALFHPGFEGIERAQSRIDAKGERDRKSTRLNSSHEWISYA